MNSIFFGLSAENHDLERKQKLHIRLKLNSEKKGWYFWVSGAKRCEKIFPMHFWRKYMTYMNEEKNSEPIVWYIM